MVMIRPRAGHFCFDTAEIATMRSEAAAVLDDGAAGIVIGALRGDGLIDETTCAQLREMARDRQVTFHRAFDQVSEPFAALNRLINLGIDRVLTSGQAPSAWEGRERLRELVEAAAGRIVIMPGCGVRAENVQQILQHSGAGEIHFSGSQLVDAPVAFWRQSVPMSAPEVPRDLQRRVTSLQQVRAIVDAAHG
jgi:copper homeostasis protein